MAINAATRQVFVEYWEAKITFAEFAKRTKEFWLAAARYLLAKWRASDAVEPMDLVQELLLEAWKSFPAFDPLRGDVADFIAYQAISRAKRWLHGQRGRRKCSRSDKAPSRHPVRFVDAMVVRGGGGALQGAEDVGSFLESILGAVDAEQDERQEMEECLADTVEMARKILERHTNSAVDQMLLQAYVDAQGDVFGALEILRGTPLREASDLENWLLKTVASAIETRREERTEFARMMDK